MAKKSRFLYLQSLLKTLSDKEIRNLKKFLTCFDTNFDPSHKVKTLQLLEYLEELGFNAGEEETAHALYDGKQDSLKFLSIRLIKKVYDSFMLDIYTENRGHYTDLTRIYLKISKEIGQVRVLWEKGVIQDIPPLLNQIIKKAKEYEYYPQMLEALGRKRDFLSLRKGVREYNRITEEIEYYEDLDKATKQARGIFSSVMYASDKKAGKLNDANLDLSIDRIGADYNRFKTGWLGFYYYMLLLTRYNTSGDYHKAAEACRSILDLMEDFSSINQPAQKGNIFVQLSNIELSANNPASSLEYSREAMKCFPESNTNWSIAKEFEFLSLFYLARLEESEKCLVVLIKKFSDSRYVNQQERFAYYKAAILFQRQEFGRANQALNEISGLMGDKEGWNVRVRLLLLLIQIEKEDIDFLDSSLDTLRKHIANLNRANSLKKRYKVIYQILKRLVKESLDFKVTGIKEKEKLGLLLSNDPDYRWESNSQEFISFPDWFLNHLERSKAAS